jgi:hypothetical protein
MIDTGAIRAALESRGWYHGAVGDIDRDDLLAVARAFGEPLETEESHGHIVSTYERVPTNPDEHIPLEFHNEAVYLAAEPAFVFFYCTQPGGFAGGGTGLIASETVLANLTPAELEDARALEGVIHLGRGNEKRYRLLRPHPRTGAASVHYAARFPRALRKIPIPRVMVLESERWLALLNRVDAICAANHTFVDWSPGTLLALDNYRMLHARYGVTDGRLVLWRALAG